MVAWWRVVPQMVSCTSTIILQQRYQILLNFQSLSLVWTLHGVCLLQVYLQVAIGVVKYTFIGNDKMDTETAEDR